jgi:hypothetical protein
VGISSSTIFVMYTGDSSAGHSDNTLQDTLPSNISEVCNTFLDFSVLLTYHYG